MNSQNAPSGGAPEAGGSIAISVITVVYNGAAHIARTLDSVLSQQCPCVECIVVDGASNDGTREIVAHYAGRLAHFISEPDRGVYDAMNKGLAAARGEHVLFMNCGDAFVDDHALAALAACLRAGRPQIVFGGWVRRDARGHLRGCRPDLERGLFNHQATLYSRTLHQRHGAYVNVKGFTTADYFFFIGIAAADDADFAVIDTPVAEIDVGGISTGLQTLSQKFAIDFLLGRTSRLKLAGVLLLHPAYRAVKRLLGTRQ